MFDLFEKRVVDEGWLDKQKQAADSLSDMKKTLAKDRLEHLTDISVMVGISHKEVQHLAMIFSSMDVGELIDIETYQKIHADLLELTKKLVEFDTWLTKAVPYEPESYAKMDKIAKQENKDVI